MTKFLTPEERKQKLEHNVGHFYFESCLDLSEGVRVYGNSSTMSAGWIALFASEVASFTTWWLFNIHPQLNGFPGMDAVRFVYHPKSDKLTVEEKSLRQRQMDEAREIANSILR